jgi:AcrR family transcriptional regulator
MAYDSAATRARLLASAYDEFVERGLAGARVDRIAATANANKQAIYAYFGSKESLFEAVLADRLGILADAVPFTPDQLPAYAGSLFDHLVADPGLVRLTQWKALEQSGPSAPEVDSHREKARALAGPAGVNEERGMDVLMLVLALVLAWPTTSPEIRGVGKPASVARLRRHRAAVVDAVSAVEGALLG